MTDKTPAKTIDLLSLKGRCAIVTGGALGIGWAIAGPMGQPDEIARIVHFLVSDLAAAMTGTFVVADGGYLLT